MGDRDEVATVPDPDADKPARVHLDAKRYVMGERIGKGGMGEVLIARDELIGREVAIKRMLDPNASARSHARFLREARVQGRLDHPSIVPVHEIGVDESGHPFFVMKRVSGKSLRELLSPQMRTRLLHAFVDACLAVEYAHVRGVLHRDLKPENIMCGEFGEVYVLDWGVAKLVGESDVIDAGSEQSGDDVATRVGTVIGTPGYMAPEQARGRRELDARADVYSLGCILYEILTGKEWAARPDNRELIEPIELDRLCMAALHEDHAQRLASARELADGVQQFLDGDRDLTARKTLADAHMAAARVALSKSSEDVGQRAIAMRESGAALALDPTRKDSIEMIGGLMLEPPSMTPEQVEESLERERFELLRGNAPAATLPMLGFLLFAICILVFTDGPRGPMIAIIGLTLAFSALTISTSFIKRFLPLIPLLTMIGLGAIVTIFARVYPPPLVAAALAALTAMTTPFTMQVYRLRASLAITGVMMAATLVPYIAELAGVFDRTFTFVPEGVLLHTGALRGSATAQIGITLAFMIATIGFAGMMGYVTRQNERAARRQLHIQSWHLRQLVER